MKRCLLLVALLSSLVSTHLASADDVATDADRQLIDAILADDLIAARKALEQGADPAARFGDTRLEDAYCAAVDRRGVAALELLLEFGLDPSLHRVDGFRSHRTPLACAIRYHNVEAFELLLALGADPDANLCQECDPRFHHSILTDALATRQFPMIFDLVHRTEVNDSEMAALEIYLSRVPFDALHPWNPIRERLIAWVEQRDPDFVARPASPPPPGKKPYCVRSLRDAIEGVHPGSICPE